jgi:hypothetical protein
MRSSRQETKTKTKYEYRRDVERAAHEGYRVMRQQRRKLKKQLDERDRRGTFGATGTPAAVTVKNAADLSPQERAKYAL